MILLQHPTIDEVFLHQKYRSIQDLLATALQDVYTMSLLQFPLPLEFRGGNNRTKQNAIKKLLNPNGRNPELYIASGFSLNIMEIVAELLVTISIDDMELTPVDNLDDVKKYSSFASGGFFNFIYDRVKEVYGDDAVPFCLQWSQDLTITSGGGGASRDATPCYLR